jgi:hypothetical protein
VQGITEFDSDTGIHVLELHYSADPDKRSPEWEREARQGLSDRQFRQEYGLDWTVSSGLPIYAEEFVPDWHVASEPLLWDKLRPVVRGWDLGATHQLPACIWLQTDAMGRVNVLRELVTWDGRSEMRAMTMGTFAEAVLLESTQCFPGAEWVDYSDPSAWTKATVGKDARSCVDDLADLRIYPRRGPVTFTDRKDNVIKLLRGAIGGRPKFLLDPRCHMLREGFQGAYKYEELGQTGRYKACADQNAWAHPMSALEYGLGGLYVMPSRERETRKTKYKRDRATGY